MLPQSSPLLLVWSGDSIPSLQLQSTLARRHYIICTVCVPIEVTGKTPIDFKGRRIVPKSMNRSYENKSEHSTSYGKQKFLKTLWLHGINNKQLIKLR